MVSYPHSDDAKPTNGNNCDEEEIIVEDNQPTEDIASLLERDVSGEFANACFSDTDEKKIN